MAGMPMGRRTTKTEAGKERVENARNAAQARKDARESVPMKGDANAYNRAQQRYDSGVGARDENQQRKALGAKLVDKMNQKNLKSYKPQIDKKSKVQRASWR